VAGRPPDIGVAARTAYDFDLGANTDVGTQFPCEHQQVKAGHSGSMTVGATAAVLLPAVLVLVEGLLDPALPWWRMLVDFSPELAPPAIAVGAAWVIVRHAPTNPSGPALAWTGGAISLMSAFDVVAQSETFAHPLPFASAVATFSTGLWPMTLAGLLGLLLVFPDGRLRGRFWQAVPWAYAVATVLLMVALWDARKVDGQVVGAPSGGVRFGLMVGGQLMVLACLVAAIASLVVRYRSGDEVMHLRVRWLMLAGVVVVALLVAGLVMSIGFAVSLEIAYAPLLIAIVVLVPVAVAIAIVRHDLFDIDRLLSDSAAWVVTLVLSAAVFGVVVLGASEVLSRSSGLDVTTATFVTALVLLPLYRYVSGAVARVVDRDRFVAVALVERFAAEVRAGSREPEEIEAVLREAQGDPGLRLVLADHDSWVDFNGEACDVGEALTLEFGGDAVARISITYSSTRARRRLAALSRAAAVPIEVCRLRLGLRASRARLAEATIAERRRLERDLHDGAQQRLIATGMRLRAVQRDLDPARSAEIDRAIAELEGTVGELRQLAHGIRPSRLDDGLGPALEAVRDATPIPVELDVSPLSALDEVQTLSAYLVVSEAVTNVLKHANATRVGVRIDEREGRLHVEVTDDGVGGVPINGALTGLRDRVESVGGAITITSTPGAGTTITAVI
jgi:signal transduction histidine kinase